MISEHLNSLNAAQTARLANMDAGAGVARVRFYAGARIAVTAAPGTGFICETPLLKPSGSVLDGVITLNPGDPGINVLSGTTTWARLVNGNGDTVFDCDVSDLAGSGEIKLPSTVLYAGGETRMVSGTLG